MMFSSLVMDASFDVLADNAGRTCMVSLSVTSAHASVCRAILRDLVGSGAPAHLIIDSLRAALSAPHPLDAGVAAIAIMRFAPSGTWVELLNAGMPPVLCLRDDGTRVLYPARSPAIHGAHAGRHPAELVGLRPGSTLLLATTRMGGEVDGAAIERLGDAIGLPRRTFFDASCRTGLTQLIRVGDLDGDAVMVAVARPKATAEAIVA